MTHSEFLAKWHDEKHIYQMWGDFVVSKIISQLASAGQDVDSYFKLPPKARIKEDTSLIDKAFFRPNKTYQNPYKEIEDKVACRFVLLLLEHVEEVATKIRDEQSWNALECRHFIDERNKDPLLFTYQSVHFVVRARESIKMGDLDIPKDTPCEIQIRTLLQHAYAELTHDSIYKTKKIVKPEIHRTIAKSMALIETTDDFFSEVHRKLMGPLENYNVVNELDLLYKSFIQKDPLPMQKSSYLVLDTFEDLIKDDFSSKMHEWLNKECHIPNIIKNKLESNPFFQQSISIFICWLIIAKRNRLKRDWPLDSEIIENFASALSVSLADY